VSGPGRLAARGALLLAAGALAALLGGCGRKAPPEVPEGRGREFTYPLEYPDPRGVVPPLPEDLRSEPSQPRRGTTIFNQSRSRTRVYGPVVQ